MSQRRINAVFCVPAPAVACMEASAESTDETVVLGVAQVDGTITLTWSGGTGPYYVMLDGVDGSPHAETSPYQWTGLGGVSDYTWRVLDQEGYDQYQMDASLVECHSVEDTIHVYREAYSSSVTKSATKSLFNTRTTDGTETTTLSQEKFHDTDYGATGVTLNSVDWTVQWTFQSTLRIENRDAGSRNITHGVNAAMSFIDGAAGLHATITPAVQRTTSLLTYDGASDFAGTSGASFANANAASPAASNQSFNEASNLARYIGAGSLSISYQAVIDVYNSGAAVADQQVQPKWGFTTIGIYNFSVTRQ